jgi:Mg-chelatase subunit ChlD
MGGGEIKQTATAAEPAAAQHGELDLVFAFDCTGSMGAHLQQAQANVKNIARQIIEAEHASVRMALVAYRDHPPQESSFETEVLDFTPSIDEMEARLMTYSAQGGGDGPECVADALYQVSQLSYRPNAAKVCIPAESLSRMRRRTASASPAMAFRTDRQTVTIHTPSHGCWRRWA